MLVYWFEPSNPLDVVGVFNTDTGVATSDSIFNYSGETPPNWPSYSLANGHVFMYQAAGGVGFPNGKIFTISNTGAVSTLDVVPPPYDMDVRSGVYYVDGNYCVLLYNPTDTSYYLAYSTDLGTWGYTLIIPLSGRTLEIYYKASVGGNFTISYNSSETNGAGEPRRYMDTFTPQGLLVNRDFINSFHIHRRGHYTATGGAVGYFQWTQATEGYNHTILTIGETTTLDLSSKANILGITNNVDGGLLIESATPGSFWYEFSATGESIPLPSGVGMLPVATFLPAEINSTFMASMFAAYPALEASGLSGTTYAFGISTSAPPFVPSWTNYVGCTES